MLGQAAFYPTLAYNLLRNYVQPKGWPWFSRIDEHLILGAMPFKSMVETVRAENVAGIVCCTEEFETKAAYNGMTRADWEEANIRFHHIPMQDFTGTSSRQNIQKAVAFIDEVASDGKSVYVHCKAGRTRSATVAVCYLMHKYDYTPNVAFGVLSQKRPHVLLHSAHWNTVHEYRRFLDSQKSSSASSSASVSDNESH